MRKWCGFTLPELLVAIALTSLLLVLGMGMVRYQQERQVRLYAQTLYHDLKWAREEAITLNVPIVMTPFANGQTTSDWCGGWLMYRDEHEASVSDTATYVIIQPGIANCDIMLGSFPSCTYVRFLPQGMSDYQNGTFSVYAHHQLVAQIVMSQTGRVRYAA